MSFLKNQTDPLPTESGVCISRASFQARATIEVSLQRATSLLIRQPQHLFLVTAPRPLAIIPSPWVVASPQNGAPAPPRSGLFSRDASAHRAPAAARDRRPASRASAVRRVVRDHASPLRTTAPDGLWRPRRRTSPFDGRRETNHAEAIHSAPSKTLTDALVALSPTVSTLLTARIAERFPEETHGNHSKLDGGAYRRKTP